MTEGSFANDMVFGDEGVSLGRGQKIDAKFLILTHLMKISQITTTNDYDRKTYKESIGFLARFMKPYANKEYIDDLKAATIETEKLLRKLETERDKKRADLNENNVTGHITLDNQFEEAREDIYKKDMDRRFEIIIGLLDIKNLLLETRGKERVRVKHDWEPPKPTEV